MQFVHSTYFFVFEPRRLTGLFALDQAVALQITMENQVGPKAEHYSQLRAWIRDSEGLANSISGPGSQTWSPAHLGGHESSDLMAIGTRYIGDPMSRWIGGHVANVLKKLPAKFTHVSCAKNMLPIRVRTD